MNIEKVIIYTGLFDDYDKLSKPIFINENIEYICFTNSKKLKSKHWKIIFINEEGSGSYLNRKVKMLPHIYLKEYKRSIYIDANVVLICNPYKLWLYLTNNNFILFEHPNKHTFLDEIKINYKNKNINKIIYNQLFLDHSNYIFFNILSMDIISVNRILVRNHNSKDVIKLMECWWHDFSKLKINRDQIILPYLLVKKNFEVKILTSKFKYLDYYIIKPHKNYAILLKIKFFICFTIFESFIRFLVKFKNYSL
tara:strand:- start:1243 stop:2001 length:759 start_codon:yes stop_codon:yes gene_type:complete